MPFQMAERAMPGNVTNVTMPPYAECRIMPIINYANYLGVIIGGLTTGQTFTENSLSVGNAITFHHLHPQKNTSAYLSHPVWAVGYPPTPTTFSDK
jgi:hypothetical protein